MMVELADAVSLLEKWTDGKAVLIRGENGNFCSGGDLDLVKELTLCGKGHHMSLLMSDNLKRLRNLPLISFAYIEGSGAIGGGAEIALSTDMRIIHKESRIGFVHRKMGIVPAWGATSFLKNLLGSNLALRILLEGRLFRSEEARSIGLVDFVEENDINIAMEKVTDILDQTDTTVVHSIKRSVLSDSVDFQGSLFVKLLGGKQNIEALQSHVKHK